MARLKPLPQSSLDAEQRTLFDAITKGERSRGRPLEDFLLEDGSLRGPFNAWLHAPGVGHPAQLLGESVRYQSRLPPRLRELAILTVAARWRADYEWWAHSRIARAEGLSEEMIAAVKAGRQPSGTDTQALMVHRFASELLENRRVSEQSYRDVTDALGDAGAVELVTLLGYYSLVSMVLNTFEVPLPAGEESPFAPGNAIGP